MSISKNDYFQELQVFWALLKDLQQINDDHFIRGIFAMTFLYFMALNCLSYFFAIPSAFRLYLSKICTLDFWYFFALAIL